MDLFCADLHIHSPHSIAVSKSLNLDTMLETCMKKGLNILGTGDILQPEWSKYMENNLKKESDGSFSYKDVYFILQTEIEDMESIHHLVLFPDFHAVKEIQRKLKPYSKNLLDEWGGRPRVNLSPSALVDVISDSGGLIGPAHAFTPFKAIFRQDKFETLKECYQDALNNVHFLELGLSANTDLADKLETLKNITFLSNSDAHSQDPRSLGREFNRLEIDNPSFEEIFLALTRKDSRKITLNVGLHPKLGKYYNMFCNKCRRRILFKKAKKQGNSIFNQYSITEDFVIFYSSNPTTSRLDYIEQVSKNKLNCPACKEEKNKNFKIKLGVSERIGKISTYHETVHPNHRPPYINAVPLIDIIRSVKGVKSTTSKTVLTEYNKIIKEFGKEFEILIDTPINELEKFDYTIAKVVDAFRNDKIDYTPGGGGTYGNINLDF
ncbi:MAG: endonuclease Q family protein [Candidatus Hermodarchaeota archaeon]